MSNLTILFQIKPKPTWSIYRFQVSFGTLYEKANLGDSHKPLAVYRSSNLSPYQGSAIWYGMDDYGKQPYLYMEIDINWPIIITCKHAGRSLIHVPFDPFGT